MKRFFKFSIAVVAMIVAVNVAAEKPDQQQRGVVKSIDVALSIRKAVFNGFTQIVCNGGESAGKLKPGTCDQLRAAMNDRDE